jgi:transaldolase
MNETHDNRTRRDKENHLSRRYQLGQSVWLDFISRELLISGHLHQLIKEDGITGMTSNPAIFEKAISTSKVYDDDIREMAFNGRSPVAIYEGLIVRDLQIAADEFRPIYDATSGRDGFVSLEVNPHLAHDTKGTVVEAGRLWRALDRPNAFIKVPATDEGVPAIQQLTSEGINVNITLLFGLPRYRQVARAYLAGIEARLNEHKDVRKITSVASFFLSRIDSHIDPVLEESTKQDGTPPVPRELVGKAALASATVAYKIYEGLFTGTAFKKFAEAGANPQRLLWASTSVKNPQFPPFKYVERLAFPNTISTDTLETIEAFSESGELKTAVQNDLPEAEQVLQCLAAEGINLDVVSKQLEEEGIVKFEHAFDTLIGVLKKKSGLTHTSDQQREEETTTR